MGRLFVSNLADYGSEYPRIFREFLGRLVDKEAQVRAQMVGIAVVLLSRKPQLAGSITEELAKRLMDSVS